MAKGISIVLLICWSIPLLAQSDTVLVDRGDMVIHLGQKVRYFADVDSKYDFNSIRLPENDKLFREEAEDVPNFSATAENVWFKFTVRNNLDQPLYLQIANLYIDSIHLYVIDTASYTVNVAGLTQKFSARDFPSDTYVMALGGARNGRTITVYGNVRTTSKHFWVPLRIGALPALAASNRNTEFISIGILGILLVMFFYNASLMIVIRQRLYVLYVFYVLTAVIYTGYYRGYFFEWFPFLLKFSVNSNVPIACLYLALQIFTNELLVVRKEIPALYRFSYLLYLVAGFIILTPLLPAWLPQLLMDFMNLAFPTYLIAAAVLSFKRKKILTTIFLAGWLPLMIVAILFTLMRNGLFYNHFFQVHGVGIAMTWEVTLFSLMMGYRFNEIRQEKLRVQAENLKLIREHNLTLEHEVRERTEEITQKNQELIQQQEEILAQRDMLEKQNQDLQISRQIINQHNQALESSVQHRTLELAQANEELQNRLHQLEQFSFVTAHNLRGPVARILGLGHIFDLQNISNPENRLILRSILESTKDIDTVIHDLGTILDVQRKKSELMEPIPFQELVTKIIKRFAKEIDEHGIVVEIHSSVNQVYSIPAYIDSIITNLLSNAIKYCSRQRQPRIIIECNERDAMYHLVVEDNGIGFDSEKYADKIFEPFQRFNTHTEGKGLGMFLIKTQVTALNGTVSLQSKIDHGTRVEIKLPHVMNEVVPSASRF